MLKRCCNTVPKRDCNSYLHVTKNKLTDKDKMKCSNNNKYVLKCYINVFYVVPKEMESVLP